MADLIAGGLYRISYNGRVEPNLYRYEGKHQPRHCQLHGEYIGESYHFRKRRNSETRPWSNSISLFDADADGYRFELVEAEARHNG